MNVSKASLKKKQENDNTFSKNPYFIGVFPVFCANASRVFKPISLCFFLLDVKCHVFATQKFGGVAINTYFCTIKPKKIEL
jgi:hypothetical protein